MSSLSLVGGGWDAAAGPALYGPFLDAAGAAPVVACVLLESGQGAMYFERWAGALTRVAACEPVPVFVSPDRILQVSDLGDADALLVCGGLTPAYAAALAPAAPRIRDWLTAGDRPYAGSSAGAAVAATRALVGGWRDHGLPVCPEDTAEDLDEISVVAGLALVDCLIDVHCAQWGTLPRLIAAVQHAPGSRGIALDEDTAVHLSDGTATVAGTGAVREVTPVPGGVTVTTRRAGGRFQLA